MFVRTQASTRERGQVKNGLLAEQSVKAPSAMPAGVGRLGMDFDPEHPSFRHRRPRPQLARRDVLRGGFWLTVGLGASPLLAACGGDNAAASADYPLARPDSPVKLPLKDSNPPIDDGLEPESGGTFNILNYDQYMAPGVMKDFGEKHGVAVEVTPYSNYDEMLSKIRAPGESFDLVFPGPSVLSKMVYGELLQPLNHSYLPNFSNLWAEYQNPWYDQEARYTVPYTIYGTGVLYRADRVTSVPERGYDLIWDEQYAGNVYLLNDKGEAIGMSLLRNGITDNINTGDPDEIRAATDSSTWSTSSTTSMRTQKSRRAPPRSIRHGLETRSPGSTTCPKARRRTCSATGGPRARTTWSGATTSRFRSPRRSRCSRTR
jgi:hypothetical protein